MLTLGTLCSGVGCPEQFDSIQGISDTQLYRQAGNGIVIDVLEAIFKKLLPR